MVFIGIQVFPCLINGLALKMTALSAYLTLEMKLQEEVRSFLN